MADYAGAVWIIGNEITKAQDELTQLTKKRDKAQAEADATTQLMAQKVREIDSFAEARDLLMNPPSEPVDESETP
ncbi:hypothetical protein SEA_JORDAN_71 [Arthrobacter phage Jordan]|nr:hypothetical protein SEA_JORDAN_71 [Arthrobacter phage Jordan]